jgi:hypothetical protein
MKISCFYITFAWLLHGAFMKLPLRIKMKYVYKFRFFILSLVIAALSLNGFSQNQPDYLESVDTVGNNLTAPKKNRKPPVRQKLFFGGYFSMRFGTVTDVELAPIVGYQLTPRFSFGTGIKYQYYNDKFYNYDTHIYGFKIFSQFNVIQDLNKLIPAGISMSIFIYGEYEGLSLESQYFDYAGIYPDQERFWLNNFLVGGGIRQPLGPRAGIYFSILWNLNESLNSIYSNPIMRIGFTF